MDEFKPSTRDSNFLYAIGDLLQWRENDYGKIVFPNCKNVSADAARTWEGDLIKPIRTFNVSYGILLEYQQAGFSDAEVEKHGPPGLGTNTNEEALKMFFGPEQLNCNMTLIVLRQHKVTAATKSAIKLFNKNYYLCLLGNTSTKGHIWVQESHVEPHSFIMDRHTLLKQKYLNILRTKKQKYSTK